ncbi:MAG TPA: response regulator, partial [Candidatus Binatia bacterium]|nr:response regulator [Candidatus Binatia bacterium]
MARTKKILIVDDERSLVELCQIILEAAGFDVRGALSGYEALNMITEDVPDLVLLDVMMPGM